LAQEVVLLPKMQMAPTTGAIAIEQIPDMTTVIF
jgi:hypothetical protein